jgi:hypothetical protein
MKVHNPNPERPLYANVFGVQYEIPAGESIDVEDAAVATSLVEYGATADRVDLDAALVVHAETNRGLNGRTASASASEGEILARQQRTVSVATGGVTEGGVPGEIKGEQLKAAVVEANLAGAQIDPKASADDRRAALAAWQARQGESTPPDVDGFEVDSAGELILDSDGQPIPTGSTAYARDEHGAIVLSEDGSPVATPQDDGTAGEETPAATALGVDPAGVTS